MKIYETKRLILRSIDIEDSGFFLKLCNTPKFLMYIGDKNIKSNEDSERHIENHFLPQIQNIGFGNYVIVEKVTNQKIGAVGVFIREEFEIPDIGFSLLPEYEGNAYAYESASYLIKVLANEFGISKVAAMTKDDNISSQKLINRLGFTFKKNVVFPKTNIELKYYEN